MYNVKVFKFWPVWIDTYIYYMYVQFMFYLQNNNLYCDSEDLKKMYTIANAKYKSVII